MNSSSAFNSGSSFAANASPAAALSAVESFDADATAALPTTEALEPELSLDPRLFDTAVPNAETVQPDDLTPVEMPSFDPAEYGVEEANGAVVHPSKLLLNPQPSLRREMVTTVMPWVVAPMGVAALFGYLATTQETAQQVDQTLRDQSIAVSKATRDRLQAARMVPQLVAPDPTMVEFSSAPMQPAAPAKAAAQAKQANLNQALKQAASASQFLDISVYDQTGQAIAASQTTQQANQQKTQWWQQTQANGEHTAVVYNAAGVAAGLDVSQAMTDPVKNQVLGAVKGRVSIEYVTKTLGAFAASRLNSTQQIQVLALDNQAMRPVGTVSAGGLRKTSDIIGGDDVAQQAKNLLQLQERDAIPESVQWVDYGEGDRGLATSVTLNGKRYVLATIPNSRWVTVVSVDQQEIAMDSSWAWGLAGTVLVLAGMAAIGLLQSSRRLSRTLAELTHAVEAAATGNLSVQVTPSGPGEVQRLAHSFNDLVSQVDVSKKNQLEAVRRVQLHQTNLLKQQQETAKRAQQLNEITIRIRQSLRWDDVMTTTVRELRQALETDRVVLYQFNPDKTGVIVAESVSGNWKNILGEFVDDPFREGLLEMYRNGRVRTMNDIDGEGLTECHRELLEGFQIRASITTPILRGDQLMGLLCAHQCSGPREWQASEIELASQLAIQTSYALEQANLLKQQEEAARYANQLNDITFQMRDTLDRQQIFSVTVQETRETLGCDRVLLYEMDAQGQGQTTHTSLSTQFPANVKAEVASLHFTPGQLDKFKRGRVQVFANILEADLNLRDLDQLQSYGVKASIVAPILVEGNLFGLLIAHECNTTRDWPEMETNFLRQIAIQLGFATEQATLFEERERARLQAEAISQEQRQQKELLQQQLMHLLQDVEGAASGDLTVRADISTGEIGTVADFFNSIVESLRQIVTDVKQSALQVGSALGESEGAMQELAQEAMKQAEGTVQTLQSVEQMKQLIEAAAKSARQAADVAHDASTTAEEGGIAMDLTVQNILSLRSTIGETAKKVKRLGESSQQISKAVSLIQQIARQTNLLAINAGIEAARAGEEGQGFAVVAEEVGELAARSAAATQEIEQIVNAIQRETGEVVEAMEQGTAQVVEGTHLVKNAKQSLEQILRVSHQIDGLVQSVSEAASSQVQTSEAIAGLMQNVAQAAGRTSDSSHQVSTSLRQTVTVAKRLQDSVEMFNVG
jgi:methyl-accepting chemotaxis protein